MSGRGRVFVPFVVVVAVSLNNYQDSWCDLDTVIHLFIGGKQQDK